MQDKSKDELIVELERMKVRERRYRVLLDDSSDPIFSFNREGEYLYVNKQFASATIDKLPEDIIGKKIWDIFPGEEGDKRFAIVRWVFENGLSKNIEVRVPRPDGDTYHLTTAKPILDSEGRVDYVICISKEITERKKLEEQLRRAAKYDGLTNLLNREYITDRLRYAITQARRNNDRLALMFVDLDGFKQINDDHGHAAGDLLLKEVARRMRGCMREADSIGRIGGDEFLILLSNVETPNNALEVAEKVRRRLDDPFELPGYPALNISSSIGVSIYPDHAGDGERLMKHADEAMYRAKDVGRNVSRLFQPT